MTLQIGLDLDGVLYPFVATLRKWMVDEQGCLGTEQCPPAVKWEFYEDWGLTSTEFAKELRDSINAGFMFIEGEPVPGSLDVINRLSDQGHHLIAVTSRSVKGAEKQVCCATLKWLAHYSIPLEGAVISPDKGILPTDLFLDDSPDNYNLLDMGAETMPVLFTQPWNASHPGRRVEDWAEFYKVVTSIDAYLHAYTDGGGDFENLFDRQIAVREAYDATRNTA